MVQEWRTTCQLVMVPRIGAGLLGHLPEIRNRVSRTRRLGVGGWTFRPRQDKSPGSIRLSTVPAIRRLNTERSSANGKRYREVVQRREGLWFHLPGRWG